MNEHKGKTMNLFNNPMVDSATKSMTPEQIEEYKRMGEYMYSSNDFTKENPQPKSMEEETIDAVFDIREAIKSGLHPNEMTPKEIQLMYEIYGEEWYKDYGFEKDEVPEPQVKIEKTKICGVDTTKPIMSAKQLKNLEKKLKRKEMRKNNPNANHKKCKK